jgi:hypothetical protein
MAKNYKRIKRIEELRVIIDLCRCAANNEKDNQREVAYEENKSIVSMYG